MHKNSYISRESTISCFISLTFYVSYVPYMLSPHMVLAVYKVKASCNALVHSASDIKFYACNTCWEVLKFGVTGNRTQDIFWLVRHSIRRQVLFNYLQYTIWKSKETKENS